MKLPLLISVWAFTTLLAAEAPPSFGDGTYVGFEPMVNLRDPLKPKASWFHENTLTIKGDAVTLNKNPVYFIDKGKKAHPARDGGIYTYNGTLRFSDGRWQLELLLTTYIGAPIDEIRKPSSPKPQVFDITNAKDGSVIIGKLNYRKATPQ